MHFRKYLFYFFYVFFLTCLFTKPSLSLTIPKGYPECAPKDIDEKKTFCPLEGRLGHKLIIVDLALFHIDFVHLLIVFAQQLFHLG